MGVMDTSRSANHERLDERTAGRRMLAHDAGNPAVNWSMPAEDVSESNSVSCKVLSVMDGASFETTVRAPAGGGAGSGQFLGGNGLGGIVSSPEGIDVEAVVARVDGSVGGRSLEHPKSRAPRQVRDVTGACSTHARGARLAVALQQMWRRRCIRIVAGLKRGCAECDRPVQTAIEAGWIGKHKKRHGSLPCKTEALIIEF